MRKFLSSNRFTSTYRNSIPSYRPEINQQKLKQWMIKLNSMANLTASKMYLAQFSGLISYYNRQFTDNTKQIDWKAWEDRILTKGLVKKVKNSFEQLNSHQYELDRIFNEVFTQQSKSIDEIDNEMTFHTVVWLDVYSDYVRFLLDLDSTSNPYDYTMMQFMDMHRGMQAVGDGLIQTHNYLHGAKDDINLMAYMGNQFAWGKKVITFYRHPCDSNLAGRATKNTMGR